MEDKIQVGYIFAKKIIVSITDAASRAENPVQTIDLVGNRNLPTPPNMGKNSSLLVYAFNTLCKSVSHGQVFIFFFFFLSVVEDQYNPRLIRDLLHDLSSTLCMLLERFILVGNINIWICRLEAILSWQEQLMNLQINPVWPHCWNFSL